MPFYCSYDWSAFLHLSTKTSFGVGAQAGLLWRFTEGALFCSAYSCIIRFRFNVR
jgi:hypothetical protein